MTGFDIVPAHLAVKAMRDNGYKNAAYAIAELIDNAIQAGASSVELLCAEEEVQLEQRKRSRIYGIGVLDNGCGMDAAVLRMALQFGNGTHLDASNQDGIGRFGMGLPSSSISQCRRVDVWTWQNGPDSAIHSFLDIDEIEAGNMREVPTPDSMPIPELFRRVGHTFDRTGTLVAWSNLDRILWKTATAVIDNSEFIIGRMYRRFLERGQTSIRMVAFNWKKVGQTLRESFARPNDPLYLMESSSCPAPFDAQPMFEMWGEPMEFHIQFDGQRHVVTVKCSYAREDAREGYNPGATDYGQHARRNVGVSIVRADRELDLDPGWSNPSEPRDRWWGVEVDFPPALDELFGVTNNKQSARNFSELAKVDISEFAEAEGLTLSGGMELLAAEQDPRLPLLEVASHIQKNVNLIRALLRTQTAGQRRVRHTDKDNGSTEAIATQATVQRKQTGYLGESDYQESQPAEQKIFEIEQTLIEEGVGAQEAKEIAASTIGRGLKYSFAIANLSSPAFFDIKARGGAVVISLNSNHPAYSRLMEVLELPLNEGDIDELRTRLQKARDGLELLLMAWARYEDEQPDGPRRTAAQEARWDWGRVARQFLDDGSL